MQKVTLEQNQVEEGTVCAQKSRYNTKESWAEVVLAVTKNAAAGRRKRATR